MIRSLPLIAALSMALPGAAMAADYRATAAAPAAAKLITRTASWTCAGPTCTARTDSSRPVVVCQGLAKKLGTIEAFLVDGQPLSADELVKCNTLARAADDASRLARN